MKEILPEILGIALVVAIIVAHQTVFPGANPQLYGFEQNNRDGDVYAPMEGN